MFRSGWSFLILLTFAVVLTACAAVQTGPTDAANMANPASVYCVNQGGKLEIKKDAAGGEYGVCVFPDGSTCDEWAYFRGECQPGGSNVAPVPAPTGTAGSSFWRIYQNETFGYRFSYPAYAEIEMNDDPLQGFTILGPEVDGENWPAISISHPAGRQEYRPPKGADLASWLTDHNLMAPNRKPDVQIAGTTAVHFRHDRSPQSYAFDTYYFARGGQLYQIIIGHTGDKEDWALYNQFLASFQFE